jgi:putrescine importer
VAEQSASSSLEALGYKPQFKRVLRLRDLIIYGLVILTPTAPYPVYGIIEKVSLGHSALAYLVAMMAMLFTAASYGKMSGAFPVAGSTYTYAQRALSEHVGFLAGWAMMLDYFLIPLLSVIYAALLTARYVPQIPYLVWAIFFTVAITLINIRGINMTARANNVMMVTLSLSAILFVVLAAHLITGSHGWSGLIVPHAIYNPATFELRPMMLGAGIATLSYIGFDAVSTLAEDVENPERNIAIATVSVCILQALFCVVQVYLAEIVWPNYHTFPSVDTAILDIGKLMGGPLMMGWITFALLVAGLGSALTGQAGASRLLFGMGRDGVISRKIFAYVDAKHSTPTRSIYFMGGITLLGAILIRFQLAVELLNFGAFVGFILVNLSVIRHYFLRRRERSGMGFVTNLVFPALGVLVCGYVWMSLSVPAKIVGFTWLALGVFYLTYLTNGFSRSPIKLEI